MPRGRPLSEVVKDGIWELRAEGLSDREIGRRLGLGLGIVSNHLRWVGGIRPRAHRRPERCLSLEEREEISRGIARGASARAIAGWLRLSYPDNEAMHVSHETIYRALYVQARGTLKRELTRHLRRGRTRRYARAQSSKRQGQGKLTGIVMISERPPEVEDRAVPGHWEGDLLMADAPARSRPWSSARPATCNSSPCPTGLARRGVRGAQAKHRHPARPASPLAHLGSGEGDLRAPPLLGRVRGRGLLL
jgi:IS30 family transposase